MTYTERVAAVPSTTILEQLASADRISLLGQVGVNPLLDDRQLWRLGSNARVMSRKMRSGVGPSTGKGRGLFGIPIK